MFLQVPKAVKAIRLEGERVLLPRVQTFGQLELPVLHLFASA